MWERVPALLTGSPVTPAGRPLRWMATQAPGGAGQNPAYRPTHHHTLTFTKRHARRARQGRFPRSGLVPWLRVRPLVSGGTHPSWPPAPRPRPGSTGRRPALCRPWRRPSLPARSGPTCPGPSSVAPRSGVDPLTGHDLPEYRYAGRWVGPRRSPRRTPETAAARGEAQRRGAGRGRTGGRCADAGGALESHDLQASPRSRSLPVRAVTCDRGERRAGGGGPDL